MKRLVLSCPECGEPMPYAFQKVCRRCGAKLIMVPQRFHWKRLRVFVQGPQATLYAFTTLVMYLTVVCAVLLVIGIVMTALN